MVGSRQAECLGCIQIERHTSPRLLAFGSWIGHGRAIYHLPPTIYRLSFVSQVRLGPAVQDDAYTVTRDGDLIPISGVNRTLHPPSPPPFLRGGEQKRLVRLTTGNGITEAVKGLDALPSKFRGQTGMAHS